ncbi:protein mono-ADP-ribosyltransferase TIPARP-like [Mixophyes fleayi]|uniref:protein mono-ADP-ribosyltransferase TIPARP-like n=1 Tax=Mixophyes fleayi TaxID=3061075 RepID=UPI003F4DF489
MAAVSQPRKKLCVRSSEIKGLKPTREEIALQALESGNWTRPVEFSSAVVVQQTQKLSREIELATFFNLKPTYHIHQEDDIDICSNFLVGKCPQYVSCPQHHTVLPYAWQLRYKCSNAWYSMKKKTQQILERLFSDPAMEKVTVKHKHSKILIDLTCMTVLKSKLYDRVRRLCTSSCSIVQFHTTYKYYYEEDNVWKQYSPTFTKCIENGLRDNCEEVFCKSLSFTYSLHLTNMEQMNLSTGTKRRMRKRPVFRSPTWHLSNCLASVCLPNSTARSNTTGRMYPKTWLITDTSLNYEGEPLICVDSEYSQVYIHFHKTMPELHYTIDQIFRVQNYFQWEKYYRKRTYMAESSGNIDKGCLERYLFHGTNTTVLEAICKQNFDPRVAGKNGAVYGKGCYFATDASYAHRYSPATSDGYHFMFLAKVLVGRPSLGKSSFVRPPSINPEDPASLLYDSCVNKTENPDIFIVFDNDQFYPYFIIRYQKISDEVVL